MNGYGGNMGYSGGYSGGMSGGSGGYSGGQSVNGNLLGITSFVEPPPIINHIVETIPVTTTVMDGISSTTAVPPQYTVTDNLTGAHSYLNFPFGADNNI